MTELFNTIGQGHPVPGRFLPVALAFIALEFMYLRFLAHHHEHDLAETAASIGVAIGDIAMRALTGIVAAVPMFILYEYRMFDIPLNVVWSWIGLFLAVEFFYYWFHRASHRVRWLWATHSVHHSATQFNLSAAIRLGWTGPLSGAFVFFLPLPLFGFHPLAVGAVLGAGLLYQFFLHTAFDVHLGPLEHVLNTPRHHRVHHASNDGCLDKNYGNVLIVFDRVFGTFANIPENEQLRYGLKGRAPSTNPFVIALGEWRHLAADTLRSRGWRKRISILFGPP